ncbi:hypothetical protein ASPBRDRAFT_134853 [Aspergillus brasiliensis CBS 101740]|uniref:Uncharacterized protein n=1 Tax=Aspergillus brasiliensis (strain CBS 101740 / IMI 381727 / IBT 21946) TaxID=767769 RepID=A0A1L9U877_ASPBC|nr:hypothetical protein ASPBRDRAFT_134853 [Aspergillus brasiliensis CBS 101740]
MGKKGDKRTKSQHASNQPAASSISTSTKENRRGFSSKGLEELYHTLSDRFGRDHDVQRTEKDDDGLTPLHYAAKILRKDTDHTNLWIYWEEEERVWEWLLKGHEQDELNVEDEDGRTPISHAAEAGNIWTVKKLIEAGCDPCRGDKNGRSPLSWAAQSGRSDVIGQLGWNVHHVDDRDNKGWTPFDYYLRSEARRCSDEQYSTKFLDFGALPLIWDRKHASDVKMCFSVTKMWSQVPSNYMSTAVLTEHDAFGHTLLSRAVQLNRSLFVQMLLTIKGIDIDVADKDGKTPLLRAIEAGNREIAKLLWDDDEVTLRLLATNADVPSVPLEWLITNGYPMDRGHGPNQETAMRIMFDIPDIAVMEHHLKQALDTEVARKKLEAAISPENTIEALPYGVRLSCLAQTDTRGLTPLALAKERRLLPIVQLFLRYRAKVEPFQDKADWFSLLQDSNGKRGFRYAEEVYPNVSLELVRKKGNIHLFDFYQAEDVTPQGRLVKRCDILQHLWLHNSKQNWIASLKYGLYHKVESYAYSSVHLDTSLSEITCVLSAEFPDPNEGFFMRHTPFQSEGIMSHKCWCISWTTPQLKEAGGIPVFYSSTLSHGQMPVSDDTFLQQYVDDLFQEWSRICDEIETHVIDHCKDDEINATTLMTNLADDSRYLATIQKALQDQTKAIQKAIDEYRRVDANHRSCLGDSEVDLRCFKATISDRLDKQHERVRDLRQMEFARLSVEETVFMRRISLITFIFLPLMFASQQSLFGMNVNALQSNPDWRWYIVFGAASLLLTYVLWKVSDQNVRLSQIWSEIRARRAMKSKEKDCEN